MNYKLDNALFRMVKTLGVSESKTAVVVYVKKIEQAKLFFESSGIKIKSIFPFINAICVEVDSGQLKNVAQASCVNFVSSKSIVSTQAYISKKVMNLYDFYNENIFGRGTCVAIIDTGISPHIDFLYPQNRIIKFVNFVDKEKSEIYDDNGHGTFISGLIASNGIASGKKYSGVAPECNIISLKALDKEGQATSIEMLEAMQWVFDNKEKYNIDVVCMSFGAMPTSRFDPLMKGAERLWESGIVVVAAAGNSGPERNTIKSPGVSRKIITVGAMDDGRDDEENYNVSNFKIADFSSRGPAFEFYKPDLVASGVNLTSCGTKTDYTKMSGTSVSAPLIAGVCALIIERYNHDITPNQVKTLLQHYSHPISRERNSEGFGYFSINNF